MAYSPSSQTAWESVYFIQEEMNAGWLPERHPSFTGPINDGSLDPALNAGRHVDKAYTAPREVNYWFGLVLLFLVMALSFTGYLLPLGPERVLGN